MEFVIFLEVSSAVHLKVPCEMTALLKRCCLRHLCALIGNSLPASHWDGEMALLHLLMSIAEISAFDSIYAVFC